jgi:hypothetical protein
VPNTAANGRRRVESVLAAWTLVHHASSPLARAKPSAAAPTGELAVSGGAVPVYVEPLPDVIARLAGAVGQLRRGLVAMLALKADAPAVATLVEIEDILRVALRAAEHHVSDEALTSEEEASLASLPARFTRLEEGGALGPVVAEMASDPVGNRVLINATGAFEPVVLVARDSAKGEPLAAVGVHLSHHEVVAAPPALTDGAWRATLKTTTARPAWTDAFRVHP